MANIANSRTVVLIGRRPKPIGELVDDLRRTKGETQIRYHKLIDEPTVEDPGFSTGSRNAICWNMDALTLEEEADSKERVVLQSGLAVAIPISTWKSSVIDVSWLARWTAAGLTLIKLVLIRSRNLKVKSGQAALISGNSG